MQRQSSWPYIFYRRSSVVAVCGRLGYRAPYPTALGRLRKLYEKLFSKNVGYHFRGFGYSIRIHTALSTASRCLVCAWLLVLQQGARDRVWIYSAIACRQPSSLKIPRQKFLSGVCGACACIYLTRTVCYSKVSWSVGLFGEPCEGVRCVECHLSDAVSRCSSVTRAPHRSLHPAVKPRAV